MAKFRFRFSILSILVVTTLIAFYFGTRDSDLASLEMNNHSILPMPLDVYPRLPGHYYLVNPKELPLDRVLRRQCLQFEALSSQQQTFVRQSMPPSTKESLWRFASRCFVFAIRHEDSEWVRAGAIALSMIGNGYDYRDFYITTGKQKGALRELNLGTSMFSEIAKFSEGSAAKQLEEQHARVSNHSIAKNLVRTRAGIGFVRHGKGPFVKGTGLLDKALRVARAIEEVDFNHKPGSFVIGQEATPTYWLSESERKRLGPTDEALQAVQFRAKSSYFDTYQRFVVDIFEFDLASTANQFQSIIDQHKPVDKQAIGNEAVIAVRFENTICIIGSKTFLHKGRTYETQESLGRFKAGIMEELKRPITGGSLD